MQDKEELTQIEKDKLAVGFDADFREIALRPPESITPNETAMFKWSGVYEQLQKGFFMVRLRIPGGVLTAKQLERAAGLATQFGQGQLCITTRQCLQFHWVRLEDVYRVLEGMREVGIITKNTGGDVTRNIVTCPLAGVCPHEEANTLKILQDIAGHPEILDELRNLPRKQKIGVIGCNRACGQTLINCQGWYPAQFNGQTGWRFYAGGGLGAKPHMAKVIFDWVPEEIVVDVARATTEVFRRLGNRKVRTLARLKFVVQEMGASAFAEKVLEVLKERNTPGIENIVLARESSSIQESFLKGQAVIPERKSGLYTVRVMIHRGEMSSEEAHRFARWSDCYGNGTILLTDRHNLQFRSVPEGNVFELQECLRDAGYGIAGFEHLPDMVACVGTAFCRIAVTDTVDLYRRMMDELTKDESWWRSLGLLRININGCPNACGQHWIADIGLRGMKKRTDAGSEEAYSIFIGGSLEGSGHLGEHVCDALSRDVTMVIRKILNIYLEKRSSAGETFGTFSRGLTGAGMKELLEIGPDKA